MPCTRKKILGFTLIEVVVAMAAFSVIVMGTMQIMAQSTKSYRGQKLIQTNLESAQFALNLMAKELRTSSIISPGASSIVFFDYSQSRCIQYQVSAGVLSKRASPIGDALFTNADPDSNRSNCSTYGFPSIGYTPLLSDISNHRFQIDPSTSLNDTPPNPHVGRVTISVTIGTGGAVATAQTTVSLRDYNYIGI